MVLPIFLLISSFMSAQFNTLSPLQSKKPESPKIIETAKEDEPLNKKNGKNFWKNIFNTTTKSDLKNEIDSLKMLLKEYSHVNNSRKDFQRIKDSLLLVTQLRYEKKREDFKNHSPGALFDFVEEPKEQLSKIVMPLRNTMSITSPYGTRVHPIFGTKRMHGGIDLKAYYENIYAVMDGVVTASGWDPGGGGNYIKIRHFNRFKTAYLHLSEVYYKVGEPVKAGFIIGKSGNTGNSTGPHLHFSVKEFGQSINPADFLNDLIKVNNLMITYPNTSTALYKPY
ncbi:metallopeptidase [Elizabethkingia anophelis]|nr:M23 family metallopeptidase [Elizabethkingia anophelis]PRQ84172.1 metallopeptidase [Elizabethkingia anophelis]PRQ85797.1 metallopeptidase [Elizabethkingia anophelis]